VRGGKPSDELVVGMRTPLSVEISGAQAPVSVFVSGRQGRGQRDIRQWCLRWRLGRCLGWFSRVFAHGLFLWLKGPSIGIN
jgi:hypothetical protein